MPDFMEKLNAAVENLQCAIDDQTFSKGARLAAVSAIDTDAEGRAGSLATSGPDHEQPAAQQHASFRRLATCPAVWMCRSIPP